MRGRDYSGEWLPAQTAEHEAGAIAQSLYVVQDRECPPRERDAVISLRLHARGGEGPDARVQVYFVPRRQAHFAGPRRRQHQEPERPLGGDRGIVKLTKSSSIDPQDTGLQPVVNPPCWASKRPSAST